MTMVAPAIPLREWLMGSDGTKVRSSTPSHRTTEGNAPGGEKHRAADMLLLQKVTAAYGISELLTHLSVGETPARDICCDVSNFAVRCSGEDVASTDGGTLLAAQKVDGVEMVSPPLSLRLVEPSFLLLDDAPDGDGNDRLGRYLEVEFLADGAFVPAASSPTTTSDTRPRNVDERAMLRSLGLTLYEIFSHLIIDGSQAGGSRRDITGDGGTTKDDNKDQGESERKKARMSTDRLGSIVPLRELGLPVSISFLVQNLLECGLDDHGSGAAQPYPYLESVGKDLHLLLLDPPRFLFDKQVSNGVVELDLREETLYGRDEEVTKIQEAFCRVSGDGNSEAIFIGGHSGSGKTRLVESLKEQIDAVGGYYVEKKFDQFELSNSNVISVFNDLCRQIKEKVQDLEETAALLTKTFGADLFLLFRLIPNVQLLLPEQPFLDHDNYDHGDQMNMLSVAFIISTFARVVSSKSHPIMIFLDDIQWVSPVSQSSLSVLETILSDKETCLLFVGNYRDNEVKHGHPIYHFMGILEHAKVPTTKLTLQGLDPSALNALVSDATGLLPRLTVSLSDLIHQKTKGNPFFSLQLLKSLVARGMMKFSIIQRKWLWNEITIRNDICITSNVLFLLTNKLNQLPPGTVQVLKVLSTFGIFVPDDVVEMLSSAGQHTDIHGCLQSLVCDSFLVQVEGGYKFAHDKILEASYGLISDDEKDEFHENLSRQLLAVLDDRQLTDAVLPIVTDQLNKGLVGQTKSVQIAKLNYQAGSLSCKRGEYYSAISYSEQALGLLPTCHWEHEYKLSLKLYFLLAKSAQAVGKSEKASETARTILRLGHSIDDKLPAYGLLVMISLSREMTENAYMTSLDVLSQLGENFSEYCDKNDLPTLVGETTRALSESEKKLIVSAEGRQTPKKIYRVLEFYGHLTLASYFVKPRVFPFVCCKMIEITLKHGMNPNGTMALISFASVLCQTSCDLLKKIDENCKIGKLGMDMLENQYDPSEVLDVRARSISVYYGILAPFAVPLQTCVSKLKAGLQTGLSAGDFTFAFLCIMQHIRLSILAGSPLGGLLSKTEHFLSLFRKHNNVLMGYYTRIYQETVSTLIDRGKSLEKGTWELSESLASARLSETLYFHQAFRCFWLGYSERCNHYIDKLLGMSATGRHHRVIITFYWGINSIRLLNRSRSGKLKSVITDAIEALKEAARLSRWNYASKVHLLEAELYSWEKEHESAGTSYAAAILSSESSGFIHEQGLACELAALHYKRTDDIGKARSLLKKARHLYQTWGSLMKVDSIEKEISLLT